MRYVCLFVLMMPVLSAQDGAAIYKERCASCHDMPAARVPSLAAIKAMSGEAIYIALISGVMKSRAEGLSTPEIFSLIGYIAPTGGTACRHGRGVHSHLQGQGCLPTLGKFARNGTAGARASTNSRFQDAASAGLPLSDVPKLKLKWAFNLGDVTMARSQPADRRRPHVHRHRDRSRVLRSMPIPAARAGDFRPRGGIRSGVTFGEANGTPAIFFGDGGATMYALNAQTGELIWKMRPVDHYATMATATPRFYKGVVYQPFASFEEALGPDPKFGCCTFRGSVVALGRRNGQETLANLHHCRSCEADKPRIAAGTQQFGPSGASVWSTPTIDEQLGGSTSPPATIIPTRQPIPAMPSSPWISRPAICCGPGN